jgi:hypothetical protein
MSPFLSTIGSSSSKSFGFLAGGKSPLTLLNGAYQNTAILGGWTFDNGGGSTTGTNTSTGLGITAPWWGGGSWISVNNISLVGVVSVTYSMYWVDNVKWTSTSPWTNSSITFPLSSGTQSIAFQTPGEGGPNGSITNATTALTGAGGTGKVSFGTGNTGSGGYVYLTKLVFNYS